MQSLKVFKDRLKYFFRFPIFNYSLAIVLFLSITIIGFSIYFFDVVKKEKMANIINISTSTSENIKQYILKVIYRGEGIVDNVEFELLKKKSILSSKEALDNSTNLKNAIPEESPYQLIGFTNENGNYIMNSEWANDPKKMEAQKNTTLKDRAYFKYLQEHSESGFVISDPVFGKTSKNWVFILAKRRFSVDGKFKGVILITISSEKLSNFFKIANPESDATVALYTESNILVSRYPFKSDKISTKVPLLEVANDTTKTMPFNYIGMCPIDKVEKIFGLANLNEFKLKVVWGIPKAIVTKAIYDKFIIVLFIEIAVLILAGFFLILKYLTLSRLEILQINEANSSRMAMIGEFSSGIAHEINNPLSVINMQTQLLMRGFQEGTKEHNRMQIILVTCDRISKIILSLKHLGHSPQSSDLVSCSLKTIVEDVLQVVEIKLNTHNVKLIYDSKDDINLRCVPSLLSQVILNLFSNSIYAIKNLEDRWIEITYEIEEDKVKLHFTDAGNGIPIEVRKKLMVSFYTTKPVGEGTGLGLSICKKIINQQHGEFFIAEDVKNTRFTIILPRGEA